MGSGLKEDQERVKNLLQNTVTLLCEKGLAFGSNLKVQGLLGVTVDDQDVFIVHINELVQNSRSNVAPFQQPPPTIKPATLSHGYMPSHPSKMASPIFPLATLSSGIAGIKRGRGRPRGSGKRFRMEEVTQSLPPPQTHPPPPPPPPPPPQPQQQQRIENPEPESPCIVIKPEPESDDPDEEPTKGAEPNEAAPDVTKLPVMVTESTAENKDPGKNAADARPPDESARASGVRSQSSSSESPDSPAEPYITGMVRNVGVNEVAGPSWNSMPGGGAQMSPGNVGPTIASISSKIAKSTIASPSSPGSNGCKVVLRMSDVEKSDCASCQQYVRRVRCNGERQRLKRKAIPEKDLPKFAEESIPMDPNCATCEQRKNYFRERSLLHEQRKRQRSYYMS